VLTCITAMFFAVQAARPRLPRRHELTADDFISGDANVLFFQDLSSLPEEEYVRVMDQIMRDRELTYHHMTRHLYGLGTGLNRKFELLKLAYGSFVFGIIAARRCSSSSSRSPPAPPRRRRWRRRRSPRRNIAMTRRNFATCPASVSRRRCSSSRVVA
jgi:hypothetical protein